MVEGDGWTDVAIVEPTALDGRVWEMGGVDTDDDGSYVVERLGGALVVMPEVDGRPEAVDPEKLSFSVGWVEMVDSFFGMPGGGGEVGSLSDVVALHLCSRQVQSRRDLPRLSARNFLILFSFCRRVPPDGRPKIWSMLSSSMSL